MCAGKDVKQLGASLSAQPCVAVGLSALGPEPILEMACDGYRCTCSPIAG